MNIDLCYHPSMKPGLSEKKNSNSEIKCLSCLARANSFCKCIAQDKLNDFSKISSQKNLKTVLIFFYKVKKMIIFTTWLKAMSKYLRYLMMVEFRLWVFYILEIFLDYIVQKAFLTLQNALVRLPAAYSITKI